MASLPEIQLTTVEDVPLLEAGVEYQLSTGPATFTPEDLQDVVAAANEDPSIPAPRLKLGHIDPRFNDPSFDATPSFGTISNLRLSDNGMTVYADYTGVPRWLAEVLPIAYPNRSVEGFWNVESRTSNKRWRFVLSACALLGVTWPGIRQLKDLPMYYTSDMPSDVVVNSSGGDAVKFNWRRTAASANLDDIRRAFYNEYVAGTEGATLWWIRAILTDPNQVVAEDDESGQLFMLSFESDGEGHVEFGNPEPVRLDYVPDNPDVRKQVAPQLASVLISGREVMATYQDRASSRPDDEGSVMDGKEVRQLLNLPEDATDEQVREKMKAKAETETEEEETQPEVQNEPGEPQPVTDVPEPKPATTGEPAEEQREEEEQPAEAIAASASNVVQLDRKAWEELKAGADAGRALKQDQDKRDREGLVKAAIEDGRIPPARKEHWLKALEADFEGNKELLASLAAGLVPLDERGTGETGESMATGGPNVEDWTNTWFPEVRARKAQEAAASGSFPQIQREEG
jgi:hypothetical protein